MTSELSPSRSDFGPGLLWSAACTKLAADASRGTTSCDTKKNKRKDFERVKKVCDTLEISPIAGLQIPKAAMFSDATATNYQL